MATLVVFPHQIVFPKGNDPQNGHDAKVQRLMQDAPLPGSPVFQRFIHAT